MKRWAAIAVATAMCPEMAHSQTKDCRAIADSIERLACYDAAAVKPAAAPSHPAEDPVIGRAKTAITRLLREPGSARYASIKVGTGVDGSKGVCGTVAGKNAFGGYSSPQLFVYDGKIGRVLVAADGANNPTKFDNLILGVALGENLKIHDKYCK